MKKLVYMLFFLIVTVSVKGQVQQPSGLPNPKSPNTYNIYGYTQDSAFLFFARDTGAFKSKYPSLMMGLDYNLYKSNGNGGAWNAITGTGTGFKLNSDSTNNESGYTTLGTSRRIADSVVNAGYTWLYPTFTSSIQKMFLMTSDDGINFKSIGDSTLYQPADYPADYFRDPSILYRNNGYYVAYTAGNFGAVPYFSLAHTNDLRNWTFQQNISTSSISNVYNTWSPEWFVDTHGNDSTYIFFTAGNYGGNDSMRLYAVKALDTTMQNYGSPVLVQGTFSKYAIDPFPYYDSIVLNKYVMFYKNDSTYYLQMDTSSNLLSGWGIYQSGNFPGFGDSVEGMTVVRTDSAFRLYADKYNTGGMIYAETKNWNTWTTPAYIQTPFTTKHGTFMRTQPIQIARNINNMVNTLQQPIYTNMNLLNPNVSKSFIAMGTTQANATQVLVSDGSSVRLMENANVDLNENLYGSSSLHLGVNIWGPNAAKTARYSGRLQFGDGTHDAFLITGQDNSYVNNKQVLINPAGAANSVGLGVNTYSPNGQFDVGGYFATKAGSTVSGQTTYTVVGPYASSVGPSAAGTLNITNNSSSGYAIARWGFIAPAKVVSADIVLGDSATGSPFTNAFTFNTNNSTISQQWGINSSIKMVLTTNGNLDVASSSPAEDITAIGNFQSSSKGFRIPTMTTTAKGTISGMVKGLLLVDSTLNYPQYFDGTQWQSTALLNTANNFVSNGNTFGSSTEKLNIGSGLLSFNTSLTGGTIQNSAGGGFYFQHYLSTTSANDSMILRSITYNGSTTKNVFAFNGIGQVGINTTPANFKAIFNLPASTSSYSSFNIASGAIPSSPNAGDFYNYNNIIFVNAPVAPQSIYTTSSIPTIAAGTGAGSSPTVSIVGTNNDGVVTITTGTLPTLSATVATITLANSLSFPNGSSVTLTPNNSNAALLSGATMVYTAGSTGTWTITAGTTALAGSTTYKWNYHVGGY